MSTLYDLFKVNEDATSEQIKESYDKILKKAESMSQDEKMIEKIRRLHIAYEILSNSEKRKKYDLDLANKRAEELLGNVRIKSKTPKDENLKPTNESNVKTLNNNVDPEVKNQQINNDNIINKAEIQEKINNQINNIIKQDENAKQQYINQMMEQKKIKQEEQKILKKAEKKAKKLQKKEMQYERERQINEYGKYLEGQGYKVKYPWTWLRIKRLLLTILSIIIGMIIVWQIPFIRKPLVQLYEENGVVKFFVDLIISIFDYIIQLIKGIFNHK